jgi:hypothetical protein
MSVKSINIANVSGFLRLPLRRAGRTAAVLGAAAALMLSLAAAHAASASKFRPAAGFHFTMVRTPGVTCLPNARANVTIVRGAQNDTMTVSVRGLPARTGFDLFVIQTPNKPFGVSWYQSDLQTDRHGKGTVVVRGIFNKETFTVDTDPLHTVAPTHQFHLGLWFNSPAKPFHLGCEGTATSPIVTPFNGEQHAGIQIVNTSNFKKRGPLARVKA